MVNINRFSLENKEAKSYKCPCACWFSKVQDLFISIFKVKFFEFPNQIP